MIRYKVNTIRKAKTFCIVVNEVNRFIIMAGEVLRIDLSQHYPKAQQFFK